MKALSFAICILVSPGAYSADQQAIEEILKIARPEARCLHSSFMNFPNKEEEQAAYLKFYRSLVDHHRKAIDLGLEDEESDIQLLLESAGNKEILVGMMLQGTLSAADEFNSQFKNHRAGKTLEEYQNFLWEVNGCAAIYSAL